MAEGTKETGREEGNGRKWKEMKEGRKETKEKERNN